MTEIALDDMLSCPASAEEDGDRGGTGAERCGARLVRREADGGYRCPRCRRGVGSGRGAPRLITGQGTSADGDAASLAGYHEMHYGAFVASYAPGGPALAGAADGPAFHVAELHRSAALTE